MEFQLGKYFNTGNIVKKTFCLVFKVMALFAAELCTNRIKVIPFWPEMVKQQISTFAKAPGLS